MYECIASIVCANKHQYQCRNLLRGAYNLVYLTCRVAVFLVGGLGFLAAATSLRSWPTLRPNDGLTLGTLEKETANNACIAVSAGNIVKQSMQLTLYMQIHHQHVQISKNYDKISIIICKMQACAKS